MTILLHVTSQSTDTSVYSYPCHHGSYHTLEAYITPLKTCITPLYILEIYDKHNMIWTFSYHIPYQRKIEVSWIKLYIHIHWIQRYMNMWHDLHLMMLILVDSWYGMWYEKVHIILCLSYISRMYRGVIQVFRGVI
jgi:hypothetical protein